MNAQTEKTFENSRDELVGQPLNLLVPELVRDRHAGHRAPLYREPRTRPMETGPELFPRWENGTQFAVEIILIAVEFCSVKIASQCHSGHKIAEIYERTAPQIFEKMKSLFTEIYHRVNNNLQVVSSLLNLQAGWLADPAVRRMFEASQSRIRSLALDLRLVKVLMSARQLNGKLRAIQFGEPKFEIVFPREARRK